MAMSMFSWNYRPFSAVEGTALYLILRGLLPSRASPTPPLPPHLPLLTSPPYDATVPMKPS